MRLYTRAEWGARSPKGTYRPVDMEDIGVLHHSAGPVPKSVDHAKTLIRGYQWQHMFTNQLAPGGAMDIGYHVLFDSAGNGYSGRPVGVRGAHAPGGNDLAGICLLGNHDVTAPTMLQRHAVASWCRSWGIKSLQPHRAFYPTACPGSHGVAFGEAINALLRGSLTSPPATDWPPPHGGSLRLSIEGLTYAGWDEAVNRMVTIARHSEGFHPTRTAIAWRGNIWRGRRDVVNVVKHLVDKFRLEYR